MLDVEQGDTSKMGLTENPQTAASGGKVKMLLAIIVVLALTTVSLLASTIILAVEANKSDSPRTPQGTTMMLDTRGPPEGTNPCQGKKPDLPDIACVIDQVEQTGEQSAVNVTKGYQGKRNTTAVPITVRYYEAGLCPVNVHWHLGAEHYSVGEFDENGSGPTDVNERRRLAGKTRQGFQCTRYDANDSKFTKPFEWKHCKDMEVGQTYEVHWPHSAAGACGTLNQFQTPFYDGVFCRAELLTNTAAQIGVQSQVFIVVNDESYYYPNLINGMIVDGEMGADLAIYTGSTTGDSRNNEICSQFAPITWQVDRKCHLVSASSFDKLCADMKTQRDDMTEDLHPHGSRELVADELAANNQRSFGTN